MAKYREIYLKLAKQIVNGELAYGTRLLSSAELAKAENISYITAHKVYELLRRNNMVEARRGQGFFVRQPGSKIFQFTDTLSVGKIGLLLSLVDRSYNDFYHKLVLRLLNSGSAPTALGYSWMMEDFSCEKAKKVLLSFAASGIETLIIRGDAHFPYRALWEVRKAFKKIIFVKFYNGEMPFEDASKVLFDMRKAGKLATGYLLEQGFNKLVFLTQEPAKEAIRRKHGISSKLFDMDILDGIEDACREAGVDFYNTGRIITRNIPYHENENEVKSQINAALDAGCNGFICMNDIRALLVYQVVAERGLVLNKDINIVSHFNTSLCESLSPKLSSVDMNIPTLIEAVANAINAPAGDTNLYVEPRLIRRK